MSDSVALARLRYQSGGMSRRTLISTFVGLVLAAGTALPVTAAQAEVAGAARVATSTVPARTALTTVEFEKRLLALTNARSTKVGYPAMNTSTALTKAARVHTRLM